MTDFLQDSNIKTLRAQVDDLSNAIDGITAEVKRPSEVTKKDINWTQVKVALGMEEKQDPVNAALGGNADTIVPTIDVDPANPFDSPALLEKHKENERNNLANLQNNVKAGLAALDGEPKEQVNMTELLNGARDVRSAIDKVNAGGHSFGESVITNPELSKLAYYSRARIASDARALELMLDNWMPPEEAQKIAQNELGIAEENIKGSPELMKLEGMTTESLDKLFTDTVTHPDNISTIESFTGDPTKRTREADPTDVLPMIAVDLTVGLGPLVGDVVGGYMAWTGDDVVMNYLSGEKRKMAGWERALQAVPLIHGIYRAPRHIKTVSGLIQSLFKSKFGLRPAGELLKRGPAHAKQAFESLKRMGDVDTAELARQISSGELVISESEEQLANIIRGVYHPNKGAGAAIITGATKIDPSSPIATIAKIARGDAEARQTLADVVGRMAKDPQSQIGKAVADSLGLDSVGVDLLIRDLRHADDASAVASEMNKGVVEFKRQAEIARKRLDNLKKARAAKAAKAAKVKAEAEGAKQVEDLPVETPKVEPEPVEVEAAKAKQVEDASPTDAPVEDAKVGDTVEGKAGDEGRVVETTDTEVVVANADGEIVTLIKEMSDEKKAFLITRIHELGSLDAVKKLYDGNDAVSVFTRQKAEEIFKGGKVKLSPAGDKIQKAMRVSRARKNYNDLISQAQKGDESAYQKLKDLLNDVKRDHLNFHEAGSSEARQKLIGEMRQTITLLEEQMTNAKLQSVLKSLKPKPVLEAPKTLLQAISNGRTVHSAVTFLVENGTAAEKAVAAKILPHIPKSLPLTVVGERHTEAHEVATALGKAVRDSKGKVTSVILRGRDFGEEVQHGLQSKTVIHEALHAATAERITKIEQDVLAGIATDADKAMARRFTRIERALKTDAIRIMHIAQETPDAIMKFGKHEMTAAAWLKRIRDSKAADTIHESIAHGFQSADLQAWMNTVQVSGGETVFDSFVNIMKKLFKIQDGSALEQIMHTTDELLPAKAAKKVKGAVKDKPLVRKAVSDKIVKVNKTVYHGTKTKFDSFKISDNDLGIHFGTKEQAGTRVAGDSGEIKSINLSLDKTIELPDVTFRSADLIMKELNKSNALSAEFKESLNKIVASLGTNNAKKLKAIRDALLREGIDGIRYQNAHEGPGLSYIVLNPNAVNTK